MFGGLSRCARAALLSGVLVSAIPTAPVFAGAASMDWTSVVQQVLPSVVNISIETLEQKNGTEQRGIEVGTGFIIDPSGIIATNKHVVNHAFRITVTLADRSQWEARLLGAGEVLDIAVLKIDVGRPLPALKFGDSAKVQIGEPIMVVGNPLGFGTSVSAGVVSGLHRNLMNTPIDDYIQTDASINHGNSGGPMLNKDGEVVGISTILITESSGQGSQGLGLAIAGDVAQYSIRRILNPNSEPVSWIGVHLQDATPDLQQAFHLQQGGGSVITAVDADSPASQAGLRVGDTVVRYGQDSPPTASMLMRDIILTPKGATVPLTIVRSGNVMQVGVQVAPMPGQISTQAEIMRTLERASEAYAPDLGLLLTPMNDEARRFYQFRVNSGAVIAAVDPTSQAYTDGISPGDVIIQVQDQPVSNPDEVFHAIDSMRTTNRVVAILVANKDGTTRWFPFYSGLMSGTPGGVPATVSAPAPGRAG